MCWTIVCVSSTLPSKLLICTHVRWVALEVSSRVYENAGFRASDQLFTCEGSTLEMLGGPPLPVRKWTGAAGLAKLLAVG